jgi:hypothetical protein
LGHAADGARHAPAAFEVGVLLAAERCRSAVGPAHHLGTVVGRVHDDGVVGDAQLVELVEQLADVPIVLHHAIGIDPQTGLALRFLLQVREDVHAGRVPPDEERLAVRVGLLDELETCREELLVHRLHAPGRERTGVLDLLRAIRVCPSVEDTSRAEFLLELGIFGIVRVLRLVLGVQVVKVAKEVNPVRMGDWPVMKAARPAVQLCCPYQSEKRAPSLATRSMLGVRYPMMPWL